jgi:cytochrome P450
MSEQVSTPVSTVTFPRPPLATGMPVFGNVLDLARDTRAFLTEKYLELGPIFRVRALNQEFIVLAGTEANLFMTREGTNYFRSREFWEGMDDELGAARSMISMDGPDHTRFRKVQQKGYGRTVIWQHLPEVIAITQNEMRHWPLNEPLPGLYSLQRIITEQLGILAADYSPREYLDDMIKFVRTMLLTRVTKQRPDVLRYTPAYRRARTRAM